MALGVSGTGRTLRATRRRDLITPTNAIGLDRSDPAAEDDIYTINDMAFPVDKPVIVYLSSLDVIHSFAISEMRVKQDAIPGMEIPAWWEPTLEGEFEINCSQLCGLGHYRMRGQVHSMSQADYDAWIAEQASLQ